MVSFKLGKEIENDVFRLVTRVGQKKNLSSHEELKLSLGAPMLYHCNLIQMEIVSYPHHEFISQKK